MTGAVDSLLDRTIAPGYSRIGLAVRRRLPGWPADPPRMDGKVVLVTGAGSGIGRATVEGLASLGASVRALTRDSRRSERLAAEVRASTGGDVRGVTCDVSDLGSLNDFCDRFTREEDRLDVLVNNAGTMPESRTVTADGVDLAFATHVLGPFVLVDRLSSLLELSAPARVIDVSSGGMYAQRLDVAALQGHDEGEYRKTVQYARTKRAEVVLSEEWAERLKGTGVVVHAMHPGWADTEGVRSYLPGFRALTRPIMRTPDEGADTIVWLAGSPAALQSTGGFWHDRRPRPVHYHSSTRESDEERRRLWEVCSALAAKA